MAEINFHLYDLCLILTPIHVSDGITDSILPTQF